MIRDNLVIESDRPSGSYLRLFIKDFDGKYEDKNLDKTSL